LCQVACPVHTDARGYVRAIAEGRFEEAYLIARGPNPFASKQTQHPRMKEGFKFIFHTPKYRHGAHTTPVDVDMIALLFGPFGDLYRHDRRMPYVNEGYVDINPSDAKELGIDDGDYVWIDPDPEDRPFRGWQNDKKNMEFARLICRARYYPGVVSSSWSITEGGFSSAYFCKMTTIRRVNGLAETDSASSKVSRIKSVQQRNHYFFDEWHLQLRARFSRAIRET
jgi:hypothetical protein